MAVVSPVATHEAVPEAVPARSVPAWVWIGVLVAALLPIAGGKTGLISNFTFLQLSLMIV